MHRRGRFPVELADDTADTLNDFGVGPGRENHENMIQVGNVQSFVRDRRGDNDVDFAYGKHGDAL